MLGLGKLFHRESAIEKAWAATEIDHTDTVILPDWVPEDQLETRPFATDIRTDA